MDEAQAVALYDETKARGAGAARFKHGLGFQAGSSDAGGRSGPRPVSAAPPQFVQQRPPGGAMPRPPIAGPRPPPGPPPPVVRGGHGGRPPPGAPPPGRPPQHMLLRPPGAPMPPMPMPPAGGLLPPPPHVAARPPFPPPPPMMPPRPPHPPMPPSGVPYLPPRGPLGRFPPPQPPGMPPPPQHTSFGPPPGGQPYGMPRLPIPGPPVPQPGYPGPPSETGPTKEVDQQSVQDAEEHQRKEGDKKQQALANLRKAEEEQRQKEEELRRKQEQESWTAHKADDTQVYYYNTMTGESSWERPQGFRGDAEKVAEKPKPVASERIEGTDWTEVKCEDKRKYYFNVVSQETVWTVPPEVSRSRAESASSRSRLPMVQGSGPPSAALPRPLPSAGPKGRGRTFPSSSTIGAAKRPFLQSKAQGPSETAVEQFKSFLQEKGVTPFSRFEREMPKLKDDERWNLISSLKEKRAIFDEFCKTTAERERHTKEVEAKSAIEGFKGLLAEVAEHEAKRKQELRESKAADREEGEMDDDDSDMVQQDDGEETIPGLGPDTTLELLGRYWGNDPRWKACPEDQRIALFEEHQGPVRRAAQAAREKQQKALVDNYRALLQERGVTASSRWSKMKDNLSQDERFQSVPRADREQYFRQYVAELQDSEQLQRKEKRERLALEREMQLRMKQDEEEADRRQRRAAHSDAMAAFQALLGETVKDPDAMWRDWKGRLERDPQGRATNPVLDIRECERLFREHVKAINDQATKEYRELLDEIIRPLFPSKESNEQGTKFPAALHTFEKAEKLMQNDNRFLRAPKDSRERLWRRYVEDFFLESDRGGRMGRDKEAALRKGRRAERDLPGIRAKIEERRTDGLRAGERDLERPEKERERGEREKDRERDRWHRSEREKEREKEKSRRRHGDEGPWPERKRARV